MSEHGKYIVIEGADGTGKSEQAKRISQRLEAMGRKVLYVINDDSGLLEPIQEPGGVEIANHLRKIIKNGNLERDPWMNVLLFTASRRANWLQAMKPALENGTDVVAARSWISTAAYQGYGEGIAIESIRYRTSTDVDEAYMNPDLQLILALEDQQERMRRINARGDLEHPDTFESKGADFQSAMQNGYLQFARHFDLEVLDASKPKDVVTEDIWEKVQKIL